VLSVKCLRFRVPFQDFRFGVWGLGFGVSDQCPAPLRPHPLSSEEVRAPSQREVIRVGQVQEGRVGRLRVGQSCGKSLRFRVLSCRAPQSQARNSATRGHRTYNSNASVSLALSLSLLPSPALARSLTPSLSLPRSLSRPVMVMTAEADWRRAAFDARKRVKVFTAPTQWMLCTCFGVKNLGFRVQGLGLRVDGQGYGSFGVRSLGCRVFSLGLRVEG